MEAKHRSRCSYFLLARSLNIQNTIDQEIVDLQVKLYYASSTKTNPQVLKQLSESSELEILSAIAGNPQTPVAISTPKILELLFADAETAGRLNFIYKEKNLANDSNSSVVEAAKSSVIDRLH